MKPIPSKFIQSIMILHIPPFLGYHTIQDGQKKLSVEEVLQRFLCESSENDDESDASSQSDTDGAEIYDPITAPDSDSDATDDIMESVVAEIHENYNVMKSHNGSEKWSRCPTEQRRRARIHNIVRHQEGPVNFVRRTCGSSPKAAFKLLITPSLVQRIAEYTNSEASAKTPSIWSETNVEELYSFFGLLLLARVLHENKTRVADLWSAKEGRPIFNATMSRNRFLELLRHIRFDKHVERDPQDKFSPLRAAFEEIVTKFRNLFDRSSIGHSLSPRDHKSNLNIFLY